MEPTIAQSWKFLSLEKGEYGYELGYGWYWRLQLQSLLIAKDKSGFETRIVGVFRFRF